MTKITKGDEVEIQSSEWNDTYTKTLIGKTGMVKATHLSIVEVSINEKTHLLHKKELKKIA